MITGQNIESEVSVERDGGTVELAILDGEGQMVRNLTPEAAIKLAHMLLSAAEQTPIVKEAIETGS